MAFHGLRLKSDGTLLRGTAVIHLPPKELAVLRLFLASPGKVISSAQLKEEIWADVHVTADSITKCISSLRSRLALDDCIQTVYKRGYRFSGEVEPFHAESGAAPCRLAIMPFGTGSAVPEHLGFAIAEETTARLANLHSPVVSLLARDSVFTLAERGLTAQQVGKALKADLVVTGNLSTLPAHFRLRAEMVRVEDGIQIWVEDVLVSKSELAGLESSLADRIAFRMGVESLNLSAANQEHLPKNREAYEIFQRARYEWQTMQRHQMQDGLRHLSRATELDPTLMDAKADLANLCVTQCFYGFMAPSVAAELVHRTANSVPRSAAGAESILSALGWVNFHWDRDLAAAMRAFADSEHLRHDAWNTRIRTVFELSCRHFDQAIDLLHSALREDPYSPWLQNRLAWALHLNGQAQASVEQILRGVSLFPAHESTSLYGAMILAYNGDAPKALKLSSDLVHRLPYFDLAISANAYALACAGRKDEAQSILERLQWLSRERFVLRSFTPAAYVALGELDVALAELRAAEKSRCPWFFQMLADPRLKPLSGNVEFAQMSAILTNMESVASLRPESPAALDQALTGAVAPSFTSRSGFLKAGEKRDAPRRLIENALVNR